MGSTGWPVTAWTAGMYAQNNQKLRNRIRALVGVLPVGLVMRVLPGCGPGYHPDRGERHMPGNAVSGDCGVMQAVEVGKEEKAAAAWVPQPRGGER